MDRRVFGVAATVWLLSSALAAARGRRPCSGKKGGVSHCKGEKFICKDGTVSASKRSCRRGDQ